jgi:hypothetical protein
MYSPEKKGFSRGRIVFCRISPLSYERIAASFSHRLIDPASGSSTACASQRPLTPESCRAKKVMIEKENTTILGGAGKKADIQARMIC